MHLTPCTRAGGPRQRWRSEPRSDATAAVCYMCLHGCRHIGCFARSIAALIAPFACGLFFQHVVLSILATISAISSARYPFSSWKELMPISSNRLTTVGPTPLTAKRASFSCLLKPICKSLLRHITPVARAAMEPRSSGIAANKGRATARLRECAFALAILISLVVISA